LRKANRRKDQTGDVKSRTTAAAQEAHQTQNEPGDGQTVGSRGQVCGLLRGGKRDCVRWSRGQIGGELRQCGKWTPFRGAFGFDQGLPIRATLGNPLPQFGCANGTILLLICSKNSVHENRYVITINPLNGELPLGIPAERGEL